jgi:hypothetical protein
MHTIIYVRPPVAGQMPPHRGRDSLAWHRSTKIIFAGNATFPESACGIRTLRRGKLAQNALFADRA